MKVYMVTGGMGVLAQQARGASHAVSIARRWYGTQHDPYSARVADKAALADHLHAGAMVFEADGGVMDPFDAYPLAGLPVPAKFARAS